MRKFFERLGRQPDCALEKSPCVVASAHPGGIVFLHSGTGAVFSANATGARMWDALREGKTPAQIGAALATELGAPAAVIAADAAAFAERLEREGLLARRRNA